MSRASATRVPISDRGRTIGAREYVAAVHAMQLYGRRVAQAADLAGFAGGAACTDATVSTPCNLIALCAELERAQPWIGRRPALRA